jgi:hypothetical protein
MRALFFDGAALHCVEAPLVINEISVWVRAGLFPPAVAHAARPGVRKVLLSNE